MNVVLAGSMVFLEKMKAIKQLLEQYGAIVTMPIDSEDASPAAIRGYNNAAVNRLQDGDVLLVVNEEKRGIRGHVGSNTLVEIGMAFALQKPIYLLNPYDVNQDCASELAALIDGVVGNDIEKWLKEAQ